jgi:hypothetical protein
MGEWLVSCGNAPAPRAIAAVQRLHLHLDGSALAPASNGSCFMRTA